MHLLPALSFLCLSEEHPPEQGFGGESPGVFSIAFLNLLDGVHRWNGFKANCLTLIEAAHWQDRPLDYETRKDEMLLESARCYINHRDSIIIRLHRLGRTLEKIISPVGSAKPLTFFYWLKNLKNSGRTAIRFSDEL